MKIAYKNIGTVTKKFYGVEFKPGDTKSVDGYINANSFVRVDASANPRNIKTTAPAPKSDVQPKTEPAPKVESKKPEVKKEDVAEGTPDTK